MDLAALIAELQSLVYHGLVSFHFTGDYWDVEWWEVPVPLDTPPDPNALDMALFRRECHVDSDYSSLIDAVQRAIEMIRTGVPGWSA